VKKALMVNVPPIERRALLEMAEQDIREPHDQIRYLIVAEATRRGLLPKEANGKPASEESQLAIA
jgi:hypothetical protein